MRERAPCFEITFWDAVEAKQKAAKEAEKAKLEANNFYLHGKQAYKEG